MGDKANLKTWLVVSIFLLGIVAGQVSADPNLIAHYTFDDGTADDSSGYSHHGTLDIGDANTSISIVYDADRDSNVLDVNNSAGVDNSVVNCGGAGGDPDPDWACIREQITIATWFTLESIHTSNIYMLTKGNTYQVTSNGTSDGMRTVMLGLSSITLTTSTSVMDGKWHHVAVTYDSIGEKRVLYIDGQEASSDTPSGLLNVHTASFVIGGRLDGSYNMRGWDGRLDDVRLYNRILLPGEIAELGRIDLNKAWCPYPEDGEKDVSPTLASIGWKAGIKAAATAGHKVYFGTDKALVEANDVSVDKGPVDSNTYSGLPMGSLSPGVDYYWKVNAVNGVNEWPGNVWSFRTLSLKASEPRPVDTSKYVGTTRTRVYWRAGFGATNHAVYFGTSKALIDANDASVYKGTFAVTCDPNWPVSPALVADEKYYWRIDVNAPVVHQGDIWSFTASTPEADPNFIAWWKFDEKSGNLVYDATGREHHGIFTQGAANTSVDIVYDADMDSNVLDYNNPAGHTTNSVVDCGAGSWADIQNQITIAAWTKVRTIHTTNYLLTKGNTYQAAGIPDGQFRVYNNNLSDTTQYSTSSLLDGPWHHIACTYDSVAMERKIYIDGNLETTEHPAGTLGVHTGSFVIGGRLQTNYYHRGWNGLIDDVCIYDRVLSEREIRGLIGVSIYTAYNPSPVNGAVYAPSDVVLSWSPGDSAADSNGHDIYFGTDFNDVNDANNSVPTGDLNGNGQVDLADVSVLTSQWLKDPPDGLKQSPDLNGDNNVNLIDFAILTEHWAECVVYKGNRTETTYSPGTLDFGPTFYWRIDEVNDSHPNSPWKGEVWSFKVEEYPTFRAFSGTCRHTRDPLRSLYDKALGWGRQDIPWIELEPYAPNDSRYVWRQNVLYDYGDLVLAYNAKDAHLLPILDYGTDWSGGYRMVDDEHVVDWQNYVERVVMFLSAPPYNMKYFQVWNEAHPCSGFWDGDMDTYMRNVHLPAAQVIQDQGCKVVYGGWPCCSDLSNLVGLLDAHNAWDSVDVLSMHYVGVEAWEYLRDAAVARGYDAMPIWATEVGYMTNLHYISNFYPRLFYWALTHNANMSADMYKVFYYREWEDGNPAGDGYHQCLYSGDNLWHLGTSLQTLSELFDSGVVSDYQGMENDRTLTAQQTMDVSSIEAFELDDDPNRIIVTIHLMGNDINDPDTDTITLTYSEFMQPADVNNIKRVDVAGYETNLTGSYDVNGLTVTVSVANDPCSQVQSWGLDGSIHNFYVVVTHNE